MLKSIRIRNFAIVEDISIDFSEGFNLITGETGTGKSLIIDALEILLGERSSSSLIRTGEKKATIEGIFHIGKSQEIEAILEEAGIPIENDLILKREISTSGAGRIFINGEMSNSMTLKKTGAFLVDIHGQHQHQSLLNPQNHLLLLDSFGENDTLCAQVSKKATCISQSIREYDDLMRESMERENTIEFLEFQLADIERISPVPGEDLQLSREMEILKNAETVKTLVSDSYGMLYEDERSVLSLLKQVEKNVEKLSAIDGESGKHLASFEEMRFSLEDLSASLRDYGRKIDFSPDRLSEVSDRSAEIERLKRRYGGTIEKVHEFRERTKEKLDRLKSSKENIEQLKKEIEELCKRYRVAAQALSQKRESDAKIFSRKVVEELMSIAMEKCRFEVQIEKEQPQNGFPFSSSVSWNEAGIDRVEFIISMNIGEELRPLSKIASGGELSRIMLAINAIMKKKNDIRTLIFDEVDAGIGAGVASKVGHKLKHLSKLHQVICITHLPQIASRADHHLRVLKKIEHGRTIVDVHALNESEKVHEIARMLAGEKISNASLKHAEEMINEKGGSRETKGRLSRNV